MKHSSSWPNHVVTVKVCIDPISRSYTIISEKNINFATSENETYDLRQIISDTKCHLLSNNKLPKVINHDKVNFDNTNTKHEVEPIRIDQSYVNSVDKVKESIAFTIGKESNLNGNIGNRSDNELLDNRQGIRFITIEESQPYKQNEALVTVDKTLKILPLEKKQITETKLVNNSVILTKNLKTPIITIADYDIATTSNSWISEQKSDAKYKSEEFLKQQIDDPLRSPVEKIRTKDLCSGKKSFLDRRFRSRSATYKLPSDFTKSFERRTKSFVESKGSENKKIDVTHPSLSSRKEVTLNRHYYPEGGWGFVIVTCSALVHFLAVGLQFAAPGTWFISAKLKFNHPPLHSSGKNAFNYVSYLLYDFIKEFPEFYGGNYRL